MPPHRVPAGGSSNPPPPNGARFSNPYASHGSSNSGLRGTTGRRSGTSGTGFHFRPRGGISASRGETSVNLGSFFSGSTSSTAAPASSSSLSSGSCGGVIEDYSRTLIEVKRRILEEAVGGAKTGDDGVTTVVQDGAQRVEEDRQRALRIAFGYASPPGAGSSGRGTRGHSTTPVRRRLSAGGSGLHPTPSRDDEEEDEEEEVCVSSVEFSLTCPYSLQLMDLPVRSRDCQHLQCCDLQSWMVMMAKTKSMRDPSTHCPHCKQRVYSSSLHMDLWMLQIAKEVMPVGTKLVILRPDGSVVSGDSAREERRRERLGDVTEIIDATQPSQVGSQCTIQQSDPLGPLERTSSGRKRSRDAVLILPHGRCVEDARPPLGRSTSPLEEVEVKQEEQEGETRGPTPPPSLTSALSHMADEEHQEHQEHQGDEEPPPTISIVQPGSGIVYSMDTSGGHSAETGGAGLSAPSRALPSAARRLWTAYCPACAAAADALGGGGGSSCPSSLSSSVATPPPALSCRVCGWEPPATLSAGDRWEPWTVARLFPPTQREGEGGGGDDGPTSSAATSMEIRPDGTVLLRGVDAAAAFLFRAGFHRSGFMATGGDGSGGALGPGILLPSPLKAAMRRSAASLGWESASEGGGSGSGPTDEDGAVAPQEAGDSSGGGADFPSHPYGRLGQQWERTYSGNGVWVSTLPLTRVELDFLEACCDRLSRGEDLTAFEVEGPPRQMVPLLFRIPARRLRGATLAASSQPPTGFSSSFLGSAWSSSGSSGTATGPGGSRHGGTSGPSSAYVQAFSSFFAGQAAAAGARSATTAITSSSVSEHPIRGPEGHWDLGSLYPAQHPPSPPPPPASRFPATSYFS